MAHLRPRSLRGGGRGAGGTIAAADDSCGGVDRGQAAIVPHLSLRERIYLLDKSAPDADYLVASESLDPWPAAGSDELRALLDARQADGYTVAIRQDG